MKDFRDRVGADLVAMMFMVEEFQKNIIGMETPTEPKLLHQKRQDFRVDFLQEEIDEMNRAYLEEDLPEVVDALVDMMYVGVGALLEMGVMPLAAFETVHEANMQKLRGVTKRGEAYDAIKPEGWIPPDHKPMLNHLAMYHAMSPAFFEATRIREERGARYNQGSVKRADHFPFGSIGHAQMMWIKAIRLRSDVEGGNGSADDLSEHIRDLINYLSFWWEELNGGIR